MAATGVLGVRFYISEASLSIATESEEEFFAQDWIEAGLIESLGEFGRVFSPVNFQAVADGRMYKLKGGFDDGNFQLTFGQDLTDPGQDYIYTQAQLSNQNNYGFRVELNDPPSAEGGPSTFFFVGLPMSYRTQMGAVNVIVKALSTVEINSAILYIPPAQLYDRYTSGSLSGYYLAHGTAPAASPVISDDMLSLVTGDLTAGTFADNGSQAINNSGFTLTSAPSETVFETRMELSAITAVSTFAGFTNEHASLQIPIESAGSVNTLTSNAADAVGFLFDTDMSTVHIWLVGDKASTPATAQDSGIAFVASTMITLRVELTDAGAANFFINGVQVGTTMANAVTDNVALYPTIAASSRGAASRTATVDYLYVRQS